MFNITVIGWKICRRSEFCSTVVQSYDGIMVRRKEIKWSGPKSSLEVRVQPWYTTGSPSGPSQQSEIGSKIIRLLKFLYSEKAKII